MDKQEAIETIKKMGEYGEYEPFTKESALNIINQINEPQKPKVPQVAVEFYEQYKDDGLGLEEWFGDFYSPVAIECFPKIDELAKWLYDNDDETNRQREFALATLVTLGINAVEVEKEPLYTVEIPDPNCVDGTTYLEKNVDGKIVLNGIFFYDCVKNNSWKRDDSVQLTESEIKEDFGWAWQWAEPVEENY